MVIWIIGKSGSGKSYLAEKLKLNLANKYKKIKWVDGDEFRKKFSKDLGYSLKHRRINSKRIQKYCKLLEKKNYLVICSILSIFLSHQKQNKKIFKKYIQIYIKVSLRLLKSRNNKKIYSKTKNVVGKDILFKEPFKSDLTIKNSFDKSFIKNISKINDILQKRL